MRPATDDDMAHHFGGQVYAKEYRLAIGQSIVQHRHSYTHLSILAAGSVRLSDGGEPRDIHGPAAVVIEAGKHHGITALTPAVWFCVHAVSDDDVTTEHDLPQAQAVADRLGLGALA